MSIPLDLSKAKITYNTNIDNKLDDGRALKQLKWYEKVEYRAFFIIIGCNNKTYSLLSEVVPCGQVRTSKAKNK